MGPRRAGARSRQRADHPEGVAGGLLRRIWTSYVDGGSSNYLTLSPGDLDEAIGGYLQFRDTPGTSIVDPGAHGSGFDRVNAFKEGYDLGAKRCADYVNEEPIVVPLEFTSQEDFDRGGDLPYEEIAPLMTADIEDYWTLVFPEVFGVEWTPLAAYGPFYVSEPETLPDCGSVQADPDGYAGTAFYCPDDDYVAWDDEGLMPDLYDSFGDFAVALVIAQESGTRGAGARRYHGTRDVRPRPAGGLLRGRMGGQDHQRRGVDHAVTWRS